MPASLTVVDHPKALTGERGLLVLGRRERLVAADVLALLPVELHATWIAAVRRAEPGDNGRSVQLHHGPAARRLFAGVLPEVCSRHNSESRAWAIPGLVSGAGAGDTDVVLALDDRDHAFAAVCAVARALPTFTATSKRTDREVRLLALTRGGPVGASDRFQRAVDAVRHAADLVDRPTATLGVDALVAEARAVADRTGAAFRLFHGRALLDEGLGGIWGVGKAAEELPAMVVLDHVPRHDAPPGDAWVGKGIVYDTGGLSIKTKTGMPGMKADMGGAAAVLCAFEAAIGLGLDRRLTAVLCIAENAIGPGATRPDDVLHLYGGRTVEVNNTDAEGRLVLADGVAWVARNRSPARVIDLATLTGAQAIATGTRMAAVVTTDELLEAEAVRAGRRSGDLCHPLPWVPEFHRPEFASSIADLKNSVKNRENAQSSCAAWFVGSQLDVVGFEGPWLHVDLAAPARSNGRGTGFGVALLLSLAGVAP